MAREDQEEEQEQNQDTVVTPLILAGCAALIAGGYAYQGKWAASFVPMLAAVYLLLHAACESCNNRPAPRR